MYLIGISFHLGQFTNNKRFPANWFLDFSGFLAKKLMPIFVVEDMTIFPVC
jgi:hypothetical protein